MTLPPAPRETSETRDHPYRRSAREASSTARTPSDRRLARTALLLQILLLLSSCARVGLDAWQRAPTLEGVLALALGLVLGITLARRLDRSRN